MISRLKQIKKPEWLDSKVLGTVFLTKILILLFAVQGYQIITNKPVGFYEFFSNWNRWDAASYLHVAQNGYSALGESRFFIVYFPLYPSLTALFQTILRDYLISAFAVSTVASIALGLVFRKLVKLDYSERVAQYSVLFLFVFPTSYFLHIPYTESLFLALSVGCFYAARQRRWLLVGILGGFAALTRINGLILLPAVCFEIYDEYRETKVFNKKWLFATGIAFGFSIYLAINYYVTGNALMFMVRQREHWARYFRLPYYGLRGVWGQIFNEQPATAQMNGVQELLFVGIGLLAIIAGWQRLRNSYRVWMIFNWLLFISTSFVQSVPRYTLIMFPMFILMGCAAVKSWWANVLLLVWSILFLAVFTLQFVKGWWAF